MTFDELIAASRANAITTEHVHRAFYSLFNTEVVDSSTTIFNHIVERFLTIFARSDDGKGWRPLPELSSMLARLEWCIRTCVTYDIHLHGDEYENGRNG